MLNLKLALGALAAEIASWSSLWLLRSQSDAALLGYLMAHGLASGLLALSVPRQYGGQEAPWSFILWAIRRLAQADSALAHLFGFHHLQVAGVLLYGQPGQHQHFLPVAVRDRQFWGNALNPLDRRVAASEDGAGCRLNGVKRFSSGSVGSDVLTLSAWHEPSGTALIGALPTDTPGIGVQADWDAFGQRQTDSGTVRFDNVRLDPVQVFQRPGATPAPRATLRSQVAQLIVTNLYLGIAQGALAEARRFVQEEARPWFASGVARQADDPYVQERFGEFRLAVRAAEVLAAISFPTLRTSSWAAASASVAMPGGRCCPTRMTCIMLLPRAARPLLPPPQLAETMPPSHGIVWPLI